MNDCTVSFDQLNASLLDKSINFSNKKKSINHTNLLNGSIDS